MIDVEPLLREFRRRDWTMLRLSVESGLNPDTISRFIQGEGVTVRTLDAIAEALGHEVRIVPIKEVRS